MNAFFALTMLLLAAAVPTASAAADHASPHCWQYDWYHNRPYWNCCDLEVTTTVGGICIRFGPSTLATDAGTLLA